MGRASARIRHVDRKRNGGTLTLLVSETVGESGKMAVMALDPAVAQRARKRIAWRILPFLFLLYIIAFLDRMNVGAAALQMPGDLGFDDRVVGLGAGMFFIGYLVLEIPGALIAERWSARRWIARIMISWGIVTVLMAFHPHFPRFLRGSFSCRRGGSRLLSRDYRLYLALVPSRGSREGGGELLRREPALVRHRLSPRRFAAGHLVVGTTRVAMAVHTGGTSCDRVWRHYNLLFNGLAPPSQMAAGGRRRLDH
jgi:hypothetical protein